MLLASSGVRAAESITVRFDNAFVDLPYPDGYCILGETEVEKTLFEWQRDALLKANNKLLGLWISCEDKQKIQSGTFTGVLEKWVIINGVLSGEEATERAYPSYDPERYKKLMAGNVDLKEAVKLAQKSIGDANEKYFDDNGAVTISGEIDLGLLSITDAVHRGMIMRVGGTEGTNIPTAAVMSFILLNGIPLAFHFYAHYTNKKTIDRLLSEAEYYSATLVHSN